MNKKTYFKKMLKNINNIYVYIGKNPIKIDRNNKKHRSLLTGKKYRKRIDEIIENNNWSTTYFDVIEGFDEKNDLFIGCSTDPFINCSGSKSEEFLLEILKELGVNARW